MKALRALMVLFGLLASGAAIAGMVEQVFDVDVTATSMYGRSYSQAIKVTLFRDDAKARSPFMVLNHGRAANPADFVKLGRAKYTANSTYFVSRGFAVFVLTRMGYGVSGGEDVEYTGTCAVRNYPAGYEAAAAQSLKVIELARSLPYIDASRGIVVGQSYGGATSIALAAKNAEGVVAAINFAGGGGGDPIGRPGNPCRPDLLEDMFASFGAKSKIPTLWLYSENDKYFGKTHPREWFDAFRRKGGSGDFVQLPANGDDGHGSFTRNPAGWRPAVEDFLRKNGF